MKQVYGRQIEVLMRVHINYVDKVDFLRSFRKAFFTSITENNIQGSFVGANLVPYDLERVISKLDIRLQTLIPPNSRLNTVLL